MAELADCSEFQENIDAPAYIAGGHHSLIVRAHNGWRPDHKWPGRRDYLRGQPFTSLGWYQYLEDGIDAAKQARDFIAAVGTLRANEYAILDHEEGAGNQINRANAWFAIVDAWAGFPATLYAGLSFCRDHLGGWERWAGRPRWLAAYQAAEPRDAHELWQNTDRARFPGLNGPVDGNIFHGSDLELLKTMRPGAAPAPASSPTAAVLGSRVLAQNRDGRLEEFVEAADGTISHRWQSRPDGPWNAGWEGLGRP